MSKHEYRAEVARLRQENEQLAGVCRQFVQAMPWAGNGFKPAELHAAYNRALAVLASLEIPWDGEPVTQSENSDNWK